jgi:DNA-binding NarL/FixJ family response regulator
LITHPLKVLLVEDDWSVRSAVKEYLTKYGYHVAEAASRTSAVACVSEFQPDVAVIDIVLPEKDGGRADFKQDTGIDIAHQFRELFPRVGIIFLSAYFDRGPEVARMFIDGHDRIVYLLKGSRPQELYNAIQNLAQGGAGLEIASGVQTQRKSLFDRGLETLNASERSCVLTALAQLSELTEPELRVFELIGSCQTRQQAADILSLSAKTISSHMDSIYTKLHLNELAAGLNPLPLLAKIYLLNRLKESL